MADTDKPLRSDPNELIGKTVSHYAVQEVLGGGGMGVVYLAEDTRLQRPVALKFLPPALSQDARSKERFLAEAQAASALDHPNICTVHEFGETDNGYDNIVGFVTPEGLEHYFEAGGACATIEEITFEDVARMKDDENVKVLDARFAREYAEAHVPGAVNASYTRLPDYFEERVPKDKTLLVHCASGARAAAASAFLARNGYEVKYVNDAFAAYAEKYEVEMDKSALAEVA